MGNRITKMQNNNNYDYIEVEMLSQNMAHHRYSKKILRGENRTIIDESDIALRYSIRIHYYTDGKEVGSEEIPWHKMNLSGTRTVQANPDFYVNYRRNQEKEAREARERQAQERIRQEQEAQAARERQEAERLAHERQEAERLAHERQEAERLAHERQEAERLAHERQDAERLAHERQEAPSIKLEPEANARERLKKMTQLARQDQDVVSTQIQHKAHALFDSVKKSRVAQEDQEIEQKKKKKEDHAETSLESIESKAHMDRDSIKKDILNDIKFLKNELQSLREQTNKIENWSKISNETVTMFRKIDLESSDFINKMEEDIKENTFEAKERQELISDIEKIKQIKTGLGNIDLKLREIDKSRASVLSFLKELTTDTKKISVDEKKQHFSAVK